MTSSSKASRRSFLKYVGAGLVAGAAAGAGYYLYGREREYRPAEASTTHVTSSFACPTSHPAQSIIISEIQVKPRYINPTTEDLIEFSYCLHGPVPTTPLLATWTVDGEEVSHEPRYASKLSQGDHAIVLKVSDEESETVTSTSVTVEPDQLYPVRPLKIKYKGVDYCAGNPYPEFGWPSPTREQMDEELDTIRNDLGCNAIILTAGADYEDDLIECGRMAMKKGFDRIYINPRYVHHSMDETVERIARFAPRVKALREASEVIHFMVGHEFSLEMSDIIPGTNWFERNDYIVKHSDWPDRVWATFPRLFKDIIAVCKEDYGYAISYAAICYGEPDVVPWSDPIFECVGTDENIAPALGATEEVVMRRLSELKSKFRKPVITPDGPSCMTYTGAGQYGGAVLWNSWESGPYDEDAQAKYIESYCGVLNRAKIEGCFYSLYREGEGSEKATGLCNSMKRKKGFYMYKSYQRTSS